MDQDDRAALGLYDRLVVGSVQHNGRDPAQKSSLPPHDHRAPFKYLRTSSRTIADMEIPRVSDSLCKAW